MEDRLDDAIHVLRNHAEAGFPSSAPGAGNAGPAVVTPDPSLISPFHLSYAPPPPPPPPNLMSDVVLNGCTVTAFVSHYIITLENYL